VKDEPGTEIEHLRAEVSQLRGDLRRDRVEKHQERIETRTTPPLSGMTRIQKRYFLEPWFTTIMIGAWTIAAVLVGVGLWFGARLIVLGGLFTIIGVGAGVAKWWHQHENSRSEGSLQSRSYD
jgi:hypothetical protein